MTFPKPEAQLRLKVDGYRKPLRLRALGRTGALETFAVEDQALEAVRFAPADAVRIVDGRPAAIPETATLYAAALEQFETLGRALQARRPRAALPVEAVIRDAKGCFWLQPPAGLRLETWLAEHPGPTPEPLVAAFARRLARALSELHAAGIVHGDLSPRTVLIDGDDVRLTGFMIDRRPFFRPLRSQTDLVEPGYAAPEAHDGALRHPLGPALDLYAASALLQRLLTGRPPPPANQAARLAGDSVWPDGIAVPSALRAGIEAGLSLAAEARPASAEAWLDGLGLGPETDTWFDGLASAPPAEPDTLDLPPLPMAATAPDAPVDPPLVLSRETPRRRRIGWWVGGGMLVALGIVASPLIASRLAPRAMPGRDASKPSTPTAPSGCQWISVGGVWRLRCANAPAQGLRLPERFDTQTTARAAAGEPAAMERLGAFYRLRAGETGNPDRGAYAYQALDWLQRAANARQDGRPDTARARDDATLALGQMLARGEGGRAPNPSAAEARLRQAAEGSRADAVLALGQFLETHAGGDAGRLGEARGLYARVAQLGDGSALQHEGEQGLARTEAALKPPPIETPAPPAREPVREAAPEPKSAPRSKPPSGKSVTPKPPAPTPRAPAPRAPPRKTPEPPRRAQSAAPTLPLRTWTASTFIKVDPTTNFAPAVELAGRAACDSEGGQALSVRTGDTLCPNGVNYCQVRAVATCQGARP